MTLRPDLCLVKLAPKVEDRRTAGGIILEPAVTPAVCYGKVVQAGARVSDVKVGDVVLFAPSSGEPVEGLFPTPHLFIPESSISAVLEPEAQTV